MNRPARGYSWAPFEPGHELSLRHGAFSPRKLAEAAADLRPVLLDPLLTDCPWLRKADVAELEDWLESEALKHKLVAELDRRIDEHGGRIPDSAKWLLERINSAKNQARAGRDRLLLNALSRLRAGWSGSDGDFDLEALIAEGQAALDGGAARLLSTGGGSCLRSGGLSDRESGEAAHRAEGDQ